MGRPAVRVLVLSLRKTATLSNSDPLPTEACELVAVLAGQGANPGKTGIKPPDQVALKGSLCVGLLDSVTRAEARGRRS